MSHPKMSENTKRSTQSSPLDQLSQIVNDIKNGVLPEISQEMSADLDAALESNKNRDPIKNWAEKLSKSAF